MTQHYYVLRIIFRANDATTIAQELGKFGVMARILGDVSGDMETLILCTNEEDFLAAYTWACNSPLINDYEELT